ncbi:MAG TPA: hypothetical protein VK178_18905 [Opitutaceae bacterium]|nr:hypothetical protein [Opitutaceae bacterium]
MTFEFIITHQPQEDDPIHDILRRRLREVLEANLNDVEDEALARMVRTTFERPQPDAGDGIRRAVLGFSLDLPGETASLRDVVDEFADALMADPIQHAVKCEDPLLRTELATRAEELFTLEMKLRRVLSIIYLHAYPDTDPYELLREETVQPMASAKPQMEQMKAAAENQFFHLTFGQYVGLNQRPPFKDKDLITLIRDRATYDALRDELARQPVEHEDDAVFLASLRERMDAVEKMRNAVAHNRRPSKKTNEAYLNALPLVNQALEGYLANLSADWRDSLDVGEWPWDTATREAVEQAMASADWDDETQTITLHDRDEPRRDKLVSSRDELVSYLEDVASSAFYASCSRDEGEYISECDESGVVEGVLSAYEERLSEFFAEREEDAAGSQPTPTSPT